MHFLKSLYLKNRLFWILGLIVAMFIISFITNFFYAITWVLAIVFYILILADILSVYNLKQGVFARRVSAEKLSNGDENPVQVMVENRFNRNINVEIIDEIPIQFQKRDFLVKITLKSGATHIAQYHLKPVKRGTYSFGAIHVYVKGVFGFVARRFSFSQPSEIPVYPSFIQMRKYELMAISNNLSEYGIKKIRRIGHNMEFEQIKEYVLGDDYRTINWKATARKGSFMVNNYQDERSQQVYCLIDKGRTMKMPFEGMTLLDYAINASLVISNIAIKKEDKAGLITFHNKISTLLPASRRNNQLSQILEALYNQKTAWQESDFSMLYTQVNRKINQRSLLLLFTNFESVVSLGRQLPFFQKLAKNHLLVVIFFENTELKQLMQGESESVQNIYVKTIAEKFQYEKKLIVKELAAHGIHSVLTTPQQLTVNTINKYLELKSRGMI